VRLDEVGSIEGVGFIEDSGCDRTVMVEQCEDGKSCVLGLDVVEGRGWEL
jgi:hypothetical protein